MVKEVIRSRRAGRLYKVWLIISTFKEGWVLGGRLWRSSEEQ